MHGHGNTSSALCGSSRRSRFAFNWSRIDCRVELVFGATIIGLFDTIAQKLSETRPSTGRHVDTGASGMVLSWKKRTGDT